MTEILGGSYDEVAESNKKPNEEHKKSHNGKHKYEAHHVWAYGSYKDVFQTKLSHGQGPSIRMEKEDHRLTASHSHNPGFKKVQNQQRELLEQGKHKEAWDMGVQDVRNACKKKEKPENTYDQHINQAEKQVLKLHQQGTIKLDESFKRELEQRQPKAENNQEHTPAASNSQQHQKPVFGKNQDLLNQQKNKGRSH